MINILLLVIALVVIVFAANLFCNALEHLGEELKISEGVTGSIFAAVGTALPETIIPMLSIAESSNNNNAGTSNTIGIGAILGAPLMLSTLSLFVMAISVIKYRGINGLVRPEPTGLKRDLQFFLFGYSLAFLAIFTHQLPFSYGLNVIISVLLGLTYFIYILLTIKNSAKLVSEGNQPTAEEPLFLTKFGVKKLPTTIFVQLILGVLILIYFAYVFIEQVNTFATTYKFSPFLLSLIIIPITTEMPEKINSIIWMRQKKDTLAIGNITGAMVFQGTLLPIIGILFTNWSLTNPLPIINIIITILASLWFYFNLKNNNIRVWHFFVNGMLYLVNITLCLLL